MLSNNDEFTIGHKNIYVSEQREYN